MEYEVIPDSAGSVGFSHESLCGGPHRLDLEIYTTSGTGSIADQLKEEQYLFKTGWVLYIVKNYINLESSIVDGILQFDWEEYLGRDFISYVVGVGFNPVYPISQNSYQALGHIGQMEDYGFWAKSSGDKYIQMGNHTCFFEFPTIKRSMTDSASYFIHWNKPRYYGALEKIQLWEYIVFGDPPTRTLVKETCDFNDTIFHVRKIEHCQLRTYELILFGKYPRDPFHEQPETAQVSESYTYYTQ